MGPEQEAANPGAGEGGQSNEVPSRAVELIPRERVPEEADVTLAPDGKYFIQCLLLL